LGGERKEGEGWAIEKGIGGGGGEWGGGGGVERGGGGGGEGGVVRGTGWFLLYLFPSRRACAGRRYFPMGGRHPHQFSALLLVDDQLCVSRPFLCSPVFSLLLSLLVIPPPFPSLSASALSKPPQLFLSVPPLPPVTSFLPHSSFLLSFCCTLLLPLSNCNPPYCPFPTLSPFFAVPLLSRPASKEEPNGEGESGGFRARGHTTTW